MISKTLNKLQDSRHISGVQGLFHENLLFLLSPIGKSMHQVTTRAATGQVETTVTELYSEQYCYWRLAFSSSSLQTKCLWYHFKYNQPNFTSVLKHILWITSDQKRTSILPKYELGKYIYIYIRLKIFEALLFIYVWFLPVMVWKKIRSWKVKSHKRYTF